MIRFLSKIIISIALFLLGFYSGQQFELNKQKISNQAIVEVEKKSEIVQPELAPVLLPTETDPVVSEKITVKKTELPEKQTTVHLFIDFGNDVKNFNNIVITDKTTVFDILKKVTAENNLEFKYTESGGMGVFIESINGSANSFKENKFWQYWVNDKYALVGAGGYILKGGDIVEWRYTKREF